MQTDQKFFQTEIPYKELKPLPHLAEKISKHREEFYNSNTIGIHIRRTDHVWAIRHSPTEKFIEVMSEELDINPATKYFLATDSAEEEKILLEHFGNRVITYKKTSLDRESIEGIQDALVDMYLLASTNKIIGSFASSFSEVAAEIGNIPLVTIGKAN